MHYYGVFEHFDLITCILYDLSLLRVIRKIQVISSLKINEFVHDRFKDLNNSLEVIMYYILIGKMTCFDLLDSLSMMSILTCMVK